MRNFDFTPYYRSTVGFDRLFDLMDKSVRSDWPPYDIEKIGQDQYRITLAVAGFGQSEIELVQHGSMLVVTGQKGERQREGVEIVHQGIPSTNFKQSYNLADHVKVTGASLENGLLTIDLAREPPVQIKPKRLDIVSGKETKGDFQKPADSSARLQSKAA